MNHDIIGQCFHSVKNGKIFGTGKVLSCFINAQEYFVIFFEWDADQILQRKIVSFDEMRDWIFYDDYEQLHFSEEFGIAREGGPYGREITAPEMYSSGIDFYEWQKNRNGKSNFIRNSTILVTEDPGEEKGEISIEDLEISVRTYNALKKAEIRKVKDMIGINLMDIDYFGKKSFRELKDQLESIGIKVTV